VISLPRTVACVVVSVTASSLEDELLRVSDEFRTSLELELVLEELEVDSDDDELLLDEELELLLDEELELLELLDEELVDDDELVELLDEELVVPVQTWLRLNVSSVPSMWALASRSVSGPAVYT